MTEILPGVVTHTDILVDVDQQQRTAGNFEAATTARKEKNLAYAYTALGVYHPSLPELKLRRLSVELVAMVEVENSRRSAHYHRYRMMTNAGIRGMLLDGIDSPLTLPEQGLLELQQRTAGMSAEEYAIAKGVYGGKGISAELGHVDQFGDWDAVRPLDTVMRELPDSTALADAGFEFGNRFDSKSNAKIDYTFNITGRLASPMVIAKRKRAAADVQAINQATGTVDTFEIVKQSSFLISDEHLAPADRKLVNRVKELGSIKKRSSAEEGYFDGAKQEAGMTIVEPLIGDRDLREMQAGVIAATSLYFALHRHQ